MALIYIQLYGVRVGVNLQIDLDALANGLGAKAAGNASGKATVHFGSIKASFNAHDLQALTDAKSARRVASNARMAARANDRTEVTCADGSTELVDSEELEAAADIYNRMTQ